MHTARTPSINRLAQVGILGMYLESKRLPAAVKCVWLIVSPRSHIPRTFTITLSSIRVHAPAYHAGAPIMIHIDVRLQSRLASIRFSGPFSVTVVYQIL